MPKVCIYRPNRSERRPFRASDLRRLTGYVIRDGATEEQLRAALNANGLMLLDDKAREVLAAVKPEDRKALEQLRLQLIEFGNLLDDIFGDTDWNVPKWIRVTVSKIPIIGKRLAIILNAAASVQSAIQGLKMFLERASIITEALEALISLSIQEEP